MHFSISVLSKNQKGFTLLEVVIALVIFTFGMLAVTRIQLASIQGNSLSHSLNTAGVLASRELEQIKNLNYEAIVSSTESTAKIHVNEMGEVVSDDELGFDVTWIVTTRIIPETGDEGAYKEVEVTVRWRDIMEHSIVVIGYAVPNRSTSLPSVLFTGT